MLNFILSVLYEAHKLQIQITLLVNEKENNDLLTFYLKFMSIDKTFTTHNFYSEEVQLANKRDVDD